MTREYKSSPEARQRAKAWYAANRERAKANVKKWQVGHPEQIGIYRQRGRPVRLAGQKRCYYRRREYYIQQSIKYLATPERREWAKGYAKEQRATNPQARIYADALHAVSFICRGMLDGSRGSKWMRILGCSAIEFRQHIEAQFGQGMSWSNRGTRRGCWQIDHIESASKFDLTKADQLARFFHFSNTRPLWADVNNRNR